MLRFFVVYWFTNWLAMLLQNNKTATLNKLK